MMSKSGSRHSARKSAGACPGVKARCASRVAGGLAVFAAVLPFVAVAPSAGAASVLPIVSPATVPPFASPATVLTMGDTAAFHGAVCDSPNSCTLVYYPWFVTPLGITALEDALATTSAETADGKIIVFGYSNGALVAEQWLEQHLNDPNIPSPERLSFVVIGNPARDLWPDSPYQVIDVSRQYDAASDYPNNLASPYYMLAVMNAGAGILDQPPQLSRCGSGRPGQCGVVGGQHHLRVDPGARASPAGRVGAVLPGTQRAVEGRDRDGLHPSGPLPLHQPAAGPRDLLGRRC